MEGSAPQPNGVRSQAEETEDEVLARVMAESEREFRLQQQQQQSTSGDNKKDANCSIN